MSTVLLSIALEEVTQPAEDPFAALNAMLNEYNVERVGRANHDAAVALRARRRRQSSRRLPGTDLLVMVHNRCAGSRQALSQSGDRITLACEGGRDCAGARLCRSSARHHKLSSTQISTTGTDIPNLAASKVIRQVIVRSGS